MLGTVCSWIISVEMVSKCRLLLSKYLAHEEEDSAEIYSALLPPSADVHSRLQRLFSVEAILNCMSVTVCHRDRVVIE